MRERKKRQGKNYNFLCPLLQWIMSHFTWSSLLLAHSRMLYVIVPSLKCHLSCGFKIQACDLELKTVLKLRLGNTRDVPPISKNVWVRESSLPSVAHFGFFYGAMVFYGSNSLKTAVLSNSDHCKTAPSTLNHSVILCGFVTAVTGTCWESYNFQ